jgi:Transmembrane domain of unknown function (DUF3566)
VSTAGQPGTTLRTDGSYGPQQMAGGVASGGEKSAAPRRVKLSVSRVDPWSVMKLSFLLSVAVGIAGVVMIVALWTILSGMGVFADMNRTVETVLNSTNGTKYNLMDYIGLGRVVSLSIVIAVIDVILVTALSTLGAFLYNVCSSLVGGLQVTLTDD